MKHISWYLSYCDTNVTICIIYIQGGPEKTDTLKKLVFSREINSFFSFSGKSYKFHLTPRWTLENTLQFSSGPNPLNFTLQQNQLFLSEGNFVANSQGGKSHIATQSKAWHRSSEALAVWQTTRPTVVRVWLPETQHVFRTLGLVWNNHHGCGHVYEYCDESHS